EALVERYLLLRLAPHIVWPQECVLPLYEDSRERPWLVRIGMTLYDLLSLGKGIRRHRMASAAGVMEQVPLLRRQQLLGGAFYYDAKGDDFRLVLSTLQSAVLAGAVAANYVRATGFEMSRDRARALVCQDELSGRSFELRARLFVNAAGPWSDQIRRMADPSLPQRVRTTMGVHLLVPWKRLPLRQALMVISSLDGRPLFAVPWRNVVLLGTTDTDFSGDPDELWATRADVDYLLESFRYYFPEVQLGDEDIISSFAGLRPLVYEPNKPASQVTREHEIFEVPRGVFNIVGGKLTTYRRMAQDLLNYVRSHQRQLHIPRRSPSASVPLYGGEVPGYAAFRQRKLQELRNDLGLPVEIAMHLLDTYGVHVQEIGEILKADAQLAKPIVEGLPFIWAQLPYAVEHEMTVALDDFLIRRTHILSLDWDQGRSVAQEVGARMQRMLGWSEVELRHQLDRYFAKVQLTRRFREEK
ncbi:MAG TPA: glycerol-3-phosphate dehydrogenase/oxidase, partial [Bacteroidetes bacterium]|nr:glycerol-3-phosphate dehydrogenase/oxidase [Bacteroidota bacterium]